MIFFLPCSTLWIAGGYPYDNEFLIHIFLLSAVNLANLIYKYVHPYARVCIIIYMEKGWLVGKLALPSGIVYLIDFQIIRCSFVGTPTL